jgi:hypothetical protein
MSADYRQRDGVTEMMNGFALVLATVLLMVVHTWRFR